MAGIVIFVMIGAALGLLIGLIQASLLKFTFGAMAMTGRIIMYVIKLLLWALPMLLLAMFWGIWAAIAFALAAGPVFLILSLILIRRNK